MQLQLRLVLSLMPFLNPFDWLTFFSWWAMFFSFIIAGNFYWILAILSSYYWVLIIFISSIQLLSRVQLIVTPQTAAHQASLSITNSWSLPKPMSIVSVMPSNHLTLCHPFLLPPSISPAPGSFQMSQLFASGGQSTGVAASASVLPVKIQG